MAKMGYREGDGLGRNKQGISKALEVEKTGKNIGRIISESGAEAASIAQPATAVAAVTAQPNAGISPDVMKNMSKVILLRVRKNFMFLICS